MIAAFKAHPYLARVVTQRLLPAHVSGLSSTLQSSSLHLCSSIKKHDPELPMRSHSADTTSSDTPASSH